MRFDEFVKEHEDRGQYNIQVTDKRKGRKGIGTVMFERTTVLVSGGGVAIKWETSHHSNGSSSAYWEAQEDFPLSFSAFDGEYDERTDMYYFEYGDFKMRMDYAKR